MIFARAAFIIASSSSKEVLTKQTLRATTPHFQWWWPASRQFGPSNDHHQARQGSSPFSSQGPSSHAQTGSHKCYCQVSHTRRKKPPIKWRINVPGNYFLSPTPLHSIRIKNFSQSIFIYTAKTDMVDFHGNEWRILLRMFLRFSHR